MERISVEEKAFQLDLSKLDPRQKEVYQRLLLDFQLHGGLNHKPHRGGVSLVVKQEILATAKNTQTYESAIQSFNMKLSSTSGFTAEHPLIGGSQDN